MHLQLRYRLLDDQLYLPQRIRRTYDAARTEYLNVVPSASACELRAGEALISDVLDRASNLGHRA